MSDKPLIALVHAIPESMPPAVAAFQSGWPETDILNLIDDSLFNDLNAGSFTRDAVVARFQALADYAMTKTTGGRKPDGLLFCCSAFAYAIEAVRKRISAPVLTPAEAALERALDTGRRIGLIVSAEGAVQPLAEELADIARSRGQTFELFPAVAEGAMAALRAGRGREHDRIVGQTIATLPPTDAIILGQFTMSRAAARLKLKPGEKVFTTPGSAVSKLRSLLMGAAADRAAL